MTPNNLSEISERLQTLIWEIQGAGEQLSDVQYRMEMKKSHLYLLEEVMGMKNAEMRDAYVNGALDTEGLKTELIEKLGRYKKLTTEKELLIEISKNLRIIEGAK